MVSGRSGREVSGGSGGVVQGGEGSSDAAFMSGGSGEGDRGVEGGGGGEEREREREREIRERREARVSWDRPLRGRMGEVIVLREVEVLEVVREEWEGLFGNNAKENFGRHIWPEGTPNFPRGVSKDANPRVKAAAKRLDEEEARRGGGRGGGSRSGGSQGGSNIGHTSLGHDANTHQQSSHRSRGAASAASVSGSRYRGPVPGNMMPSGRGRGFPFADPSLHPGLTARTYESGFFCNVRKNDGDPETFFKPGSK
ncbi:MAG: hypothetical protein M1827_002101 [Pycnora praestabilis]|nr:MAG: hypothetical protein M1827_002101 [Pycnora praestabilis]